MRTKDTVITNVKQKFTVNVGFGLKKAYLKYKKYRVRICVFIQLEKKPTEKFHTLMLLRKSARLPILGSIFL